MLNAGAPVHVVQRYLGHLSPEMAMRYAATLASTAEREFLAMVKISRDGREIGMDRRDMLDLMQLDRRTDRVLPNGYCLLPPVRSCDKGNACHGCDHFATDKTYLPEIRRQLAETEQLIERRKAQHLARYGEPMSENNVWLEQRLAELRSMRLEIAALQAQPERHRCRPRRGRVRQARLPARPGTGHPHQEAIRVMTSARSQPDPQQPGSSAAQRRADALRRAAQAKRQAATARAETAIRKLVKNQQEISFRAVARTGGVSLDFLYANDDLRGRIEALRARQAAKAPAAPAEPSSSHADAGVVDALTARLREERAARLAAVRDLEDKLAAAHGELLRLRRVLQQHGIQA